MPSGCSEGKLQLNARMVRLSDSNMLPALAHLSGIISSATNESLNLPLSKGVFSLMASMSIELGFYLLFGQREAETGWQYFLPVPIRTNVLPHSNISSDFTALPSACFSNCCSLQLVSDRQHFRLSAIIQSQMTTPHFDVCS